MNDLLSKNMKFLASVGHWIKKCSYAPNLFKDSFLFAAKAATANSLELVGVFGQGAWGIVYETDKREIAFKVTADPAEAEITHDLMKSGLDRALDGLPTFHSIYQSKESTVIHKAGQGFMYALVRENIQPQKVNPETYEQLMQVAYAGTVRSPTAMARLFEAALRNFHAPELEKILEALLRIFNDLGIMLVDVHPQNVGVRIFQDPVTGKRPDYNMLVAFDLGHSQTPPTQRDFARLEGIQFPRL